MRKLYAACWLLAAAVCQGAAAQADSTAASWKAGPETVVMAEKGHLGFNFREENVPP
jgi:hypothetical protein